jgi:hypothetical protein
MVNRIQGSGRPAAAGLLLGSGSAAADHGPATGGLLGIRERAPHGVWLLLQASENDSQRLRMRLSFRSIDRSVQS